MCDPISVADDVAHEDPALMALPCADNLLTGHSHFFPFAASGWAVPGCILFNKPLTQATSIQKAIPPESLSNQPPWCICPFTNSRALRHRAVICLASFLGKTARFAILSALGPTSAAARSTSAALKALSLTDKFGSIFFSTLRSDLI